MISKEEALMIQGSTYGQRQAALRKKEKQREWDLYFLKMVSLVASKSPDPKTQIGCVIVGPDNAVLSTGYNGLPRGIEPTKARLSRENDEKYYWMEHAETNAIFNAARHGTALKKSHAYILGLPCPRCASALIQSGVVTITIPMNTPLTEHAARWKDKYRRSAVMLREAKILIRKVNIDEA
jgi:dCMP deaminase